MGTKEQLKARVCAAIDASREQIFSIAEDVFQHPELGFKETWTAGRVERTLRDLGVPFRSGLALTGVKGWLETGRPGPSVALLGELDSVLVPEHPYADPQTGAAHACGHPMQLAAMLGGGMGLVHSGVLPHLSGRIALFAVPAEEYVEVEYRTDLARKGRIELLSGKSELVRLGEFDDIDMALMVHIASTPDDRQAAINESSNGMLAKQMQFLGQASHAGAAPWAGVNALNAAHVAIAAMHAQRETFRDDDSVRVHPIITKGGALVNIVPDDVRMEMYVRAKSLEAIVDAAAKVDRAARAGAVALGGRVRIETMFGYLPLRNDPTLAALFKQNMLEFISADQFVEGVHLCASTDMGDITHIMPGLQPLVGGATGIVHGKDFAIVDPVHAYLNSAKSLAMTVVDLLADQAECAKQLLASFKPTMSRAEYLRFVRALSHVEEFDGASLGQGL